MNPAPAKHTPGPWRYSKERRAIVADCCPSWDDPSDPEHERVTKVCSTLGALGGHNPDADLAAMTAAPELLAALESALALIEADQPDWTAIIKAARAAIARATGNQ